MVPLTALRPKNERRTIEANCQVITVSLRLIHSYDDFQVMSGRTTAVVVIGPIDVRKRVHNPRRRGGAGTPESDPFETWQEARFNLGSA